MDTHKSSLAGGETMASPTSSATVSVQQQGLQASTSKPTIEDQEKYIFEIFKEMKLRNEVLKTNTYNQF